MPPAAIPSNSPSPHYRQHHQVQEPRIDSGTFHPAWRRRTRLDQLFDAGRITAREHRIATEFRRLYETAHRGALSASTWDRVFVDPGCRQAPAPEMTERQADALDLVRRVETALGALYVLLVWFVVEDLASRELADRLAVDPRTAKTWCAAAVAGLAAL